MRIVTIVGKNRSGKSTVAKKLIEKTSWPTIEVSDIVKKISGQKTREALQLEKEKHAKDPDWLYRELKKEIDRIASAGANNIVVSGVREQYLIQRMKEDGSNVKVIGVSIADSERRRRTVELDKKSIEEFEKDESRDKELFNLDDLLKSSDYQVSTETSLEDMEDGVEKVLKQLELSSK